MSSTTFLLSTICIHSILAVPFWSRIQHFCVLNSVSLILNGVMEKIWAWTSYLFEGTRRLFYIFSLYSSKLLFLQDNITTSRTSLSFFASIFYLVTPSVINTGSEFWLWPPRKHFSPHHAPYYESLVPQYPAVPSPAHQNLSITFLILSEAYV